MFYFTFSFADIYLVGMKTNINNTYVLWNILKRGHHSYPLRSLRQNSRIALVVVTVVPFTDIRTALLGRSKSVSLYWRT